MARQGIGTGSSPNDGSGDNLRVGAGKINDNFSEIYNYFGDVDFGTRTRGFKFKSIVSKGAFCIHYRDSNFNYLPEEEKIKKLNRRRYHLVEDWARFKIKYNLPNDLPYRSINKIDFNKLQNQFDRRLRVV